MVLGRPQIAGLVLGAFATLLTALGLWLVIDAVTFTAAARTAQGEVITVEREVIADVGSGQAGGEDTIVFRPTFRYVDALGLARTAVSDSATSGYDFAVGTRMEILYRPERPGQVRIKGVLSVFLMPVACLGAGLAMLAISVFAFRRRAKRPAGGATRRAEKKEATRG